MAGKRDKKGAARPIVIVKKNEIIEGGGHGGAWKVAYADFVTAMMAFFLLMWLLNATTEDQRKGLADYFSPNNLLSHASSGTGEPFGGHTAFDEGALVSDRGSVEITEGKRPQLQSTPDSDPQVFTQAQQQAANADTATDPGLATPDPTLADPSMLGQQPRASGAAAAAQGGGERGSQGAAQGTDGDRQPTQAEIAAEKERQEKVAFEKAADDIRAAVRNDPELAQLAKQLAIDMTPEGLRIQIMDEVKAPMFATGSAAPNDRARELLRKVAPFLQRLPESISIAGYTDATPYAGAGKTNWELSSERANATRRLLTDGGLADQRILTVTGHADRDPLLPGDPLAAANRRIAIVVLRNTQPASGSGAVPAGDATRPPAAATAAQGLPAPAAPMAAPVAAPMAAPVATLMAAPTAAPAAAPMAAPAAARAPSAAPAR